MDLGKIAYPSEKNMYNWLLTILHTSKWAPYFLKIQYKLKP